MTERNGAAFETPHQRLDKWLWFARLAKSRSFAAALVTGGKIRVNRARTLKPSHTVKPGDVITSSAQKTVRIVRVLAAGVRRGPAAEARALYEELTPASAEPKALARSPLRFALAGSEGARSGERPQGAGRPTKRDRRQIERLKGHSG